MTVEGRYDAIIVGGGACGCTTAYFLAQEGLRVLLLDKGRVGREASWASAGMVGPDTCPHRDPWFRDATHLSRDLYDRLAEELPEVTGRRYAYGGEGSLALATTDEEETAVTELVDRQRASDVEVRAITATEVREREPLLPDSVRGAAWSPGGRYVDARGYTATVAAAAKAGGVQVEEGRPATALAWNGDRVIGVQSGETTWHAEVVINCAGAWAGGIDPRLSHPVYPLHGQIMAISAPPMNLRHNISRCGTWGYLTPRPDGRVLVGATHDDWGFRKQVTPGGMGYLSGVVANIMPSLSKQRVLDVWCGLRPGTVDALATVGPDPRVTSGYLWGAGHASSGMLQMPATATVLVDLVLHREPAIPIGQLAFDRYLNASYVTGAEPRPERGHRFMSA